VLAGAEGVAELAEIDKLRHLRLAHDELGAALDFLVLVRKAPGERVARIVRPLDDFQKLSLEVIHEAHSRECVEWFERLFFEAGGV
jgi:hypothetical protein